MFDAYKLKKCSGFSANEKPVCTTFQVILTISRTWLKNTKNPVLKEEINLMTFYLLTYIYYNLKSKIISATPNIYGSDST